MRITYGYDTTTENNYAYEGQLISGFTNNESRGATLLSYDEIFDFDLGEDYYYNENNEGIMPKLYYTDKKELIPNQPDLILERENILEIQHIEVHKTNDLEADISILLKNENEVEITDVQIDGLSYNITRNITSNGQTNVVLHVSPENYYDFYKLSKITYKENNVETELEFETKIELQFFRKIYNFEDWQNIEEDGYENILIMADIDFSGRSNMKANLKVNRMEANSMKTLKNIDLTFDSTDTGLISNAIFDIKNIRFENVKITTTYEEALISGNVGVIAITTGNLENLEFENIEISGLPGEFQGCIGKQTGGEYINNIKVKNINITGICVGSVVGYTDAKTISNIQAENMTYTMWYGGYNSGYAGGVIGLSEYADSVKNVSVKEFNITQSSFCGAVAAKLSYCELTENIQVEDCTINAKTGNGYAGGAFGQFYYSSSSLGEIHDVYVRNTDITATRYAGGIMGYGIFPCVYDSYINADITATSYSAGGVSGYGSSFNEIKNVMVVDSTITANRYASAAVAQGSYNDELISNFYVEADIKGGSSYTNKSLLYGSNTESSSMPIEVNISNIFVYAYSKINNTYAFEAQNLNVEDLTFLTRSELDEEATYTNTIGLGEDWNMSVVADGKYPILTDENVYIPETQIGIDLPTDPAGVSINSMENGISLMSIDPGEQEDLSDDSISLPIDVSVYPVSAYEINIDFGGIPENTSFTYYINGEEKETIELKEKTYTFKYNYQDEIKIKLTNGEKEQEVIINPEDVRSEVSLTGSNNAYLAGNSLYINGQVQEGEYINVYEGYALNNNNQVLNLESNEILNDTLAGSMLEENAKPLHTYNYKEYNIDVYGTYSKVNDNIKLQIYNVKNGKLSALLTETNMKIDNYITDNYNNKEYQTILNGDGELVDIKETLQYPDEFSNSDIKQIEQNTDAEKTEAIVMYNSGKVLVFNYVTGNIIFETR